MKPTSGLGYLTCTTLYPSCTLQLSCELRYLRVTISLFLTPFSLLSRNSVHFKFKKKSLVQLVLLTMHGEPGPCPDTSKIITRLAKIHPFIFRLSVLYLQSSIDRLRPPGRHDLILSKPRDFGWGHPADLALQHGRISHQNGNVFRLLRELGTLWNTIESGGWVSIFQNTEKSKLFQQLPLFPEIACPCLGLARICNSHKVQMGA